MQSVTDAINVAEHAPEVQWRYVNGWPVIIEMQPGDARTALPGGIDDK
jgi:hypothetical protein